ncbi:MAG: hypothetical protein WA192_00400 [Candidatus Acidiferrales bacterium]
MPDEAFPRAKLAQSAPSEDLHSLIHDPDEDTLIALLDNPHIAEPHISQMLERLDLSAHVLTAIAEKGKWIASEGVRLRLARHPHTPRRFALALLRQLYLFDLVRLSLLPSAPAEIRRVAEELMVTRVPQLPIGQKLTLARRGPARVVGAILAEGQPQAIKLALANAFLTESQVLKVLAKAGVPERVVATIAQHPRWSVQYNVRVALIRNPHTPVPVVLAFLPNLTLRDLKELATLEGVASPVRRYIQRELSRRSGTS